MVDELENSREACEDVEQGAEQPVPEASDAVEVLSADEGPLAEIDIAMPPESPELVETEESGDYADSPAVGESEEPQEQEKLEASDEPDGQRIIVDGDEAPEKAPIPVGDKIMGAAKMVAGGALAAAAVPLVVVPIAPTSLMAVGGVTLAAKGQREFSGREISKFEVKAEAATEKITKVTKNTTGGLLSRLGEASTRAAQKLSETDWDEKLGLNEE